MARLGKAICIVLAVVGAYCVLLELEQITGRGLVTPIVDFVKARL
jgi:hypothetical protein